MLGLHVRVKLFHVGLGIELRLLCRCSKCLTDCLPLTHVVNTCRHLCSRITESPDWHPNAPSPHFPLALVRHSPQRKRDIKAIPDLPFHLALKPATPQPDFLHAFLSSCPLPLAAFPYSDCTAFATTSAPSWWLYPSLWMHFG